MDKEQLVTVAVARQMVHAALDSPMAETQAGIAHQKRGTPRRGAGFFQEVGIKSPRPQRAVKLCPCRRRLRMDHLRGRTVESLFAELALKSIRRQIGVRLARSGSFNARKRDPSSNHRSTPRAI